MLKIRNSLFAALIGATSAVVALDQVRAEDKSLTFVSYQGTLQDSQIKAWQQPYTASKNVQFENDSPPDGAKLKAMVEAGAVSWDVMDQGAAFAEQNCGKLLEKLDFSKIDTSQFPEGSVSDCGVPVYFFALTFVYNTEKYKDHPPTKLADFFDLKNFPGTRVLPPDISLGTLEYALMADGVDSKNLYPIDVDRALKKLDTIKSSIIFTKTNGALQQALVDGQADMGFAVTGRVMASAKAGAPIAPVWDKTILGWDALIVPKGTANLATAMDFVQFVSHPEQNKRFAELAGVIAATSKATPDYSDLNKTFNPRLHDETGDKVLLSNVKWWSANLNSVIAKVTPWMSR
ncbi:MULTISPECIES: ABC transporter substrate-binding protein [unclassified Rhizobium]|uniref:ABC transporter substrate-binding protein n=1 Tax=unclassified Rhizobium TaxID=2613769 RepID=UPI0038242A1E